MKTSALPKLVLFTIFVSLFVVSCRDNDTDSTPSPKSKQRGARMMGYMSYSDWQSNLNWQQQNWLNQQSNPEDKGYSLWMDEQQFGSWLSSKDLDQNVEISNPLFCFEVAALGALHTSSIGATLAREWVQMTYTENWAYVRTDIMFNFDVGKGEALNNPNQSGMIDRVYNRMFVSPGNNYKVPGAVFYGNYYGVNLFENPLGEEGSFTLPGSSRQTSAIFLQPSQKNNTDLIKHEFGHVLQAESFGLSCFYSEVAINSLVSASDNGVNGYNHQCYYTETDANRRSRQFHLDFTSDHVWNTTAYPLNCSGYDASTPCQ